MLTCNNFSKEPTGTPAATTTLFDRLQSREMVHSLFAYKINLVQQLAQAVLSDDITKVQQLVTAEDVVTIIQTPGAAPLSPLHIAAQKNLFKVCIPCKFTLKLPFRALRFFYQCAPQIL